MTITMMIMMSTTKMMTKTRTSNINDTVIYSPLTITLPMKCNNQGGLLKDLEVLASLFKIHQLEKSRMNPLLSPVLSCEMPRPQTVTIISFLT